MRRFARFCLLLVSAVLSLSCELLPAAAVVSLVVPPTPPGWKAAWGPASYAISWRSAGSRGELDASVAPGQVVRLTIPRSAPVVIRADPGWPQAPSRSSPALGAGERVAWAGAVWPAGLDANACAGASSRASSPRPGAARDGALRPVLCLRFETGPVVAVLWRLMQAGVDLRRFSVERLLQEVSERLPADPWALDVERVAAAIASGSMRESYVRPPDRHAVDIAAPLGSWYGFSPFRPPVTGEAPWGDLPAGVSPFYSADGRRVIVEVDSAGRAWSSPAGRATGLR